MAKDDLQNKDAAQPRVYKASEVHKRRAAKPADKQVEPPAEQESGEAPGENAVAEPAEGARAAAPQPAAPQPDVTQPDVTQPIAQPAAGEAQAAGSAAAAREDAAAEAPEPAGESSPEAPDDTPRRRLTRRTAETDEPADHQARSPKKRSGVAMQVLGIIGAAVAAVLLMFVGYFVANRWFVYDDRASIQGTWFIAGTSIPWTFTEDELILDAQTEYEYTVDTTAKTITYRFGNLEGHGRYWFSADRRYLVITDGGDYTMWTTLAEDLSRFAGDLFADLFGDGAPLPSSDTATVLSTTPTVDLG